jgi:hypothetical protein
MMTGPCAAGKSGEIVSRGRITMPGYWQREDANREARYVDECGEVWLRSGDIGYLDEQGFLYIVDRKKDMILSGGQNIYPQDIEAVLVEHPEVDDVAVIGAKSERWGETPWPWSCRAVTWPWRPSTGPTSAWAGSSAWRTAWRSARCRAIPMARYSSANCAGSTRREAL